MRRGEEKERKIESELRQKKRERESRSEQKGSTKGERGPATRHRKGNASRVNEIIKEVIVGRARREI